MKQARPDVVVIFGDDQHEQFHDDNMPTFAIYHGESLPRQKLRGGTSEILNWVALAGAVEPMQMKLVDYVPSYRSPAATGCGMAFAYWIQE